MEFQSSSVSKRQMVNLYEHLVLPRLIEEKMLNLLRQGKIGKWFSGIGQEAIAVGVTAALSKDDFIYPLHRNLGVFTTRNVPLHKLFAQWMGKEKGFTKGRDRSFHFGAPDYGIIGMISHLGAMLNVANGSALAHKLDEEPNISVAFTGEGGTSEGDFHEALNLAAVWDLPVLFVVENNGYGLSTPTTEQFRCQNIADKGIGYGIESKTIDGNNILEVFETVAQIRQQMIEYPKPFLLECNTFRMRGHEEASGIKYVPQDLLDRWAKKDPISHFEKFLIKEEILKESKVKNIKNNFIAEIEEALEKAFNENNPVANEINELKDVYAPYTFSSIKENTETEELRFVDAIKEALEIGMEQHENIIFMGQDIAEYGGVFKITEGFIEKFGKDRVCNTPIMESGVLGAALGLSLKNKKSMVEMQFADFVSCGFNQIVNNLAKTYYRWGHSADVVVRMPTGAGVNAGPFHSQSNEAWFFHVPGLIIVYPFDAYSAKGLLLESLRHKGPILFFEHKKLYRSQKSLVPKGDYTLEIGKAHVVQEGQDATIITYGMGVHWALEISKKLDLSLEIIDLRTLLPWDKSAVETAVKKTNKVLILHEDTLTGGIGAEISAWINEYCFEFLDAPVMRVASLDTPVPMAAELENDFLASARLEKQLQTLMNY